MLASKRLKFETKNVSSPGEHSFPLTKFLGGPRGFGRRHYRIANRSPRPPKVYSGLIHDWIGAPRSLPPPESFMDTLDPIYSSFPTHRLLDETMRDRLRVLLAREARRWVEEDVPAGRTATSTWRSHGAPTTGRHASGPKTHDRFFAEEALAA